MAQTRAFILCEHDEELRQFARVNLGMMLDGSRAHHRRGDVTAGVAAASLGRDAIAEDFADMIADAVRHFNRPALFDLS